MDDPVWMEPPPSRRPTACPSSARHHCTMILAHYLVPPEARAFLKKLFNNECLRTKRRKPTTYWPAAWWLCPEL